MSKDQVMMFAVQVVQPHCARKARNELSDVSV